MATTTAFHGGRARPARNVRYLATGAAALLAWYGINVSPTWGAMPVLAPDIVQVLGILNVALLATAAANAVFIAFDRPWFKAAVQALVAAVATFLAAQLYVVYPFDFSRFSFVNADAVTRTALAVAVGAGIVRVIMLTVRFVRSATRAMDDARFARQVKTAMEARTQVIATVSSAVPDGVLAAVVRPSHGEPPNPAPESPLRSATREAATEAVASRRSRGAHAAKDTKRRQVARPSRGRRRAHASHS